MITRPPLGTVPELLKQLRVRARYSVRAAAEVAELSPSAYQHYESPRYKKPYIPMELAEKLSGAFALNGVDPADLYALAGVDEAAETMRNAPPGLGEAEATPFQVEGETEKALLYSLAPRAPNTDAWTIRSRALDLAGLLPGDVALVDLDAAAIAGADDTVCAQIYDWRAGDAVTVFRIYDPPYLVAASTDPQFRRPQLVDDNRVSIKGVVVAAFRRRA